MAKPFAGADQIEPATAIPATAGVIFIDENGEGPGCGCGSVKAPLSPATAPALIPRHHHPDGYPREMHTALVALALVVVAGGTQALQR